MSNKTEALIALFVGFPSYRPGKDEGKAALAAYLASLEGFPLETVEAAVRQSLKRGGAFPPSSPEFYEVCSRVAADRHAEQKRLYEAKAPRLPRPIEKLSLAEREASKARAQAMVDRFKGSSSMRNASKTPAEVREDAQSWLVENAGGHGLSSVRISAELAALIEEKRQW
jgi:hypothetical protein